MMNKKLSLLAACSFFSSILPMDIQKTYKITGGPYLGQEVKYIETKELDKVLNEKGVKNILLARIANLEEEDKMALMKTINTTDTVKIFNNLPQHLKGPVTLCLFQGEKKYFDTQFLTRESQN